MKAQCIWDLQHFSFSPGGFADSDTSEKNVKAEELTIFQKIIGQALTLYLNTGFIILLSAIIVGIN